MDRDEIKYVLGSAYLFTVISCVFSLLARMTAIFSAPSPQDGARDFLGGDLLWAILALGIIFVLGRLNGNRKQGLAETMNDGRIRKTAAVLLIADGLLKLADAYADFAKYLSTFRNFQLNGIGTESMSGPLAGNVVRLAVFVLQILVGLYLLRRFRGGSEAKRP